MSRREGWRTVPPAVKRPDYEAHNVPCRHVHPDRMFPSEDNDRAVERAKAICRPCPLLVACREWATRSGWQGVWGGTSGVERHALRRRLGVAS